MRTFTVRHQRGRSRLTWFGIALVLISVGLIWRLVPLGLNVLALKYGGSVLWAAMIYCLCAALLASQSITATVCLACCMALGTEMLRLYHEPWLDAFRLTLPGALLLGRIFSVWNLVAYVAGIGFVALCERAATSQPASSHSQTRER
ncbi:DUF2809 domain-containing protein [Methylobacterium sp. WL30]|uniref:ribosomal maturation YjgA family protein n=1 Tax=unclassified Methylobacterium TaxID=2615210 RepID=UPI0011C78C79|nr:MULTISPECIES: DUF2809 domain-containing protein [unclassified Methylobacterium]TXN41210.1 DUF2809 domain-containing protein [Methylobacterium sp. WL93]TXN50622.1 DUF2809 domain-containing protein [Methylobacterium sp. WL119]TXN68237.1 DUF2809 domain-containing protein [Methylobacterium sp. WL30]TXN73040.1 DUF2809 domain-containing protein [Methylobacterium sp. WL6]